MKRGKHKIVVRPAVSSVGPKKACKVTRAKTKRNSIEREC
jgi:hypothetical protein